ncbi:immunoglobulin-like domain-containing protein [Flavobacterium sp.]|uniref:immunoglobulin-like domain-containing protein n=2 Tax=Flavobacterium sp. TaxID=239 RepID=UPI0040348918
MKKILRYKAAIAICTIAMAITSCSNEDAVSSSVTYYAVLDMAGDRITVLNEGDTFTDPGVTATIDGQPVDVTVDGTVDTSTPGVYDIYYSSINEDGFPAEVRRIVIVLESDPSSVNLEGTFYRNGNPNTVTRLADRVYQANNAGGLALSDDKNLLNVTFYNIDDEQLYIPYQENVSVSGIDVESISGQIVNQNSFNWVLSASSYYGTAVRNFTR